MNPETFAKQYSEAAHAIQTAVAHDINCEGAKGAAADSKHLRTGLNMVMAEFSGLLFLLMRKGVITEDEMHEALLDALEQEKRRYEKLYPGFRFA